jgi:hypothetical protein
LENKNKTYVPYALNKRSRLVNANNVPKMAKTEKKSRQKIQYNVLLATSDSILRVSRTIDARNAKITQKLHFIINKASKNG